MAGEEDELPEEENDEEKTYPEERDFAAEGLPRRLAYKAEWIMDYLQLIVSFLLLGLFAVAVYDLGLEMLHFFVTGKIFDPVNVIALLETALLLFLVVEVFRTAVAHLEDLKVLPLVIDVAIIGVVRNIITYRIGAFETLNNALVAAISYAAVLLALIVAFFVIHRQERKSPDSHPNV